MKPLWETWEVFLFPFIFTQLPGQANYDIHVGNKADTELFSGVTSL